MRARYVLLLAAFGLTMLGLVMIYSASSITALSKEGASLYYFTRQAIFIAVGWAGALLIGRFDYRRLKDLGIPIWGFSVVLLVAVLVIGYVSHGAKRWIPLGLFNLQPSEIAKVACLVAISIFAVQWRRGKLETKAFLARVTVLTCVPAALIMLQPDMGTTAVLVMAVVMILVLAGIGIRPMLGAGATLAALVAVFVMSSDYRMERVLGFLDPWADPAEKGYQAIQALYAFGSGGLSGVGLGFSRQKFFYLPEAHTDFILAIIGEELGLIGTLAVLLGFVVFAWAGFKIAMGARDEFGRLLAGGVTGMIAFQAAMNMAAVTGMIPITGKPLPFISYGGSSMLATTLALGLLLSVSAYGTLAPRAVRSSKAGAASVQRPDKERMRESSRDWRVDRRTHIPRTRRSQKAARRA